MPGGGLNIKMFLSPQLADIVGKRKASRGEITKMVWAYIKRKGLLVNFNKL